MITSNQFQEELRDFLKIVNVSGATTALEIGSGELGTSLMISATMGDGSLVVSVDLPEEDGGTRATVEAEALASVGSGALLRVVRGRSSESGTVRQVSEALAGRTADVLFIDAEHTERAARNDLDSYRHLLSEKAIAAFHDICTLELWPMWNSIRGTMPPARTIEIIRSPYQRGCGIGVLLLRP